MEDTEVGKTERQVSVGSDLVVEHEAVSGAVHGLHSESLVLNLAKENVVLVVGVMAGSFPQLQVEEVGGNGFRVTSNTVLFADHLNELVVDDGTMGVEETAAGRKLIHVEKLLSAAHTSVVSLLGLFLEVQVLSELLLAGEGNTVDSLQSVVFAFGEPVSTRVLHDFECLDQACGRNMRASAQINQVSALVGSHVGSILNLAANHGDLEGVGTEELEGFLFGEHQSLESLLLFHDLGRRVFQGFVVLFGEDLPQKQSISIKIRVRCPHQVAQNSIFCSGQ